MSLSKRIGPPLMASLIGICVGVYTFKPALEKMHFDRQAKAVEKSDPDRTSDKKQS
ncbi:hypothetical protein IW148_005210 [Coemansia sp. RSA 1199]|nr:hypothetical protein IW148_005210 [Coemansia sp. RSA 1199]